MTPHAEGPAKALVAWSGGRKGFQALGRALADPDLDVVGLLSTVTETLAPMVGQPQVPLELVETQARMLRLPLHTITIPPGCVNETYQQIMQDAMLAHAADGIEAIVHGDRDAEVRAYRDEQLARAGMRGVYPLWDDDPSELVQAFVARHDAIVLASPQADLVGRTAHACDPSSRAALADSPMFVHASPVMRAPVPCRIQHHEGQAVLVPGAASDDPVRVEDAGAPE